MPDFRLQPTFPIASVIDAAQRNNQIQQQAREAGNKSLIEGLQSIGQIGQSLYDTKKRVAQSLAIGRQFDIPDDVAKNMDPSQLLQIGAIKKGNVDMSMLLSMLHPGAGGTNTPAGATPASQTTPAPTSKTPGPILASDVTRTPIAEPTAQPSTPTPAIAPSLTPGATTSVPVPIQAPPLRPTSVNKATFDAAMKLANQNRIEPVVTQAEALASRGVKPGTHIINPKSGADTSDPKYQQKLEKQYQDMKLKALSNRSGGLGIEDGKVNQGIHLRKAINTTYDPKTGEFKIPPSMHSELVIGLARMLSQNGNVAAETINELRQRTIKEGAANVLISMGFDPTEVGGTTQSVAKFFVHQLDRQAQTAEENRAGYMDYLRGQAPVDLDPQIMAKHDKVGLNSYSEVLNKSPDQMAKDLGTSYTDPAKEKRFQEWKARQSL